MFPATPKRCGNRRGVVDDQRPELAWETRLKIELVSTAGLGLAPTEQLLHGQADEAMAALDDQRRCATHSTIRQVFADAEKYRTSWHIACVFAAATFIGSTDRKPPFVDSRRPCFAIRLRRFVREFAAFDFRKTEFVLC